MPPEANAIHFHALDGSVPLQDLLKLAAPAFQRAERVFAQVKYLEDYIRRPDTIPLPERTVAIEEHYVDRDFMSDHSSLFASTLRPPPNHCRRVHFFGSKTADVSDRLVKLGELLTREEVNHREEYVRQCSEFSEAHYLGFAVIRPLGACPVGRTVLRLLPHKKDEDGSIRVMNCTRDYQIHFMGVMLQIRGLAFQQQDLGVSRCSTIALWSALHKAGQKEHLSTATPADITNRASRYRLPFGRPMPSEGLAVEQMCLALQSLGVAPFLGKVGSFEQGRSLIFSATLSTMPCVLAMEFTGDPGLWHAVTVVGMKLSNTHEVCLLEAGNPGAGDDDSGDLKALYVHDDRVGPYLRAEVLRSGSQLRVRLNVEGHAAHGVIQEWIVRQVLIPTHVKVRVSFNDLRSLFRQAILPDIQKTVAATKIKDLISLPKVDETTPQLPTVRFRCWIERGFRYVQRVLEEQLLSPDGLLRFRTEHLLSRYAGIIRCSSETFGQIDVLVDTTSPRPNYAWLAVVAKEGADDQGNLRNIIAEYLADKCDCVRFK